MRIPLGGPPNHYPSNDHGDKQVRITELGRGNVRLYQSVGLLPKDNKHV
jgi:hypothetical protein